MQFEVDPGDAREGSAQLSKAECVVLRSVLVSRLLALAMSTNEPSYEDRVLAKTAEMILKFPYREDAEITLICNASNISILAETVKIHASEVPKGYVVSAYGLYTDMRAAADVLQSNVHHDDSIQSQAEIDSIVREMVIPDSPEGLI